MAYTKYYADWQNSPSTATPITEAAMDHIEDGIVAAHALIPPGAIVAYGGASAPSGWLLCDGSSVSQATYADLYAAIGLAYGNPGGGNFNLPDMRGRVPVGKGTHTDVDAVGDSDGMATVGDRRPKHKHTVNESSHTHNIQATTGATGGNNYLTKFGTGSGATAVTDGTTTGLTVGLQTNTPTDGAAYLVHNFIIKT